MGLLDNIFGSAKKKEAEKKDYLSKLLPYQKWIDNYSELEIQLLQYDMDVIKQNVDKIILTFDFENFLEEKYGEEIGKKLVKEGVFIGMSEEQFDDCMKYKVIVGEEKTHEHLESGIKKPYSIRKVTTTESGDKVLRTNSTKLRYSKRVDFTFVQDKLTQIKKYTQVD
jgi:hypothetical protein